MPKRHTRRNNHLVAARLADALPLVGVQSEIEKQAEHLRPIVTHRDSEKPAGVLDGIDQRALDLSGPKPANVCQRHGGRCGQVRPAFAEAPGNGGEHAKGLRAGEVSSEIEGREALASAGRRVSAMIEDPLYNWLLQ